MIRRLCHHHHVGSKQHITLGGGISFTNSIRNSGTTRISTGNMNGTYCRLNINSSIINHTGTSSSMMRSTSSSISQRHVMMTSSISLLSYPMTTMIRNNAMMTTSRTNATTSTTMTGGTMIRSIINSTKMTTASTTRTISCHNWKQKLLSHNHRRYYSSTTTKKNSSSSSSSSTKQEKGPKSMSFMEWYEGHLSRHPIYTKMITGSILWGLGDVVAQIIPPLFFPTPAIGTVTTADEAAATTESNSTLSSIINHYDTIRTIRACTFGCIFHAPLSHLHFNLLEYMTIRTGFTGYYIPLFKTIMEQFVYWSWFSNSLYHGIMEILTSMTINPTAIYNRIADVLWETQKAQWIFWIPIQLLNFQYIPVRHQLNVVLLTSIVWTALLSMWYPPNTTPKIEKEVALLSTEESEKK